MFEKVTAVPHCSCWGFGGSPPRCPAAYAGGCSVTPPVGHEHCAHEKRDAETHLCPLQSKHTNTHTVQQTVLWAKPISLLQLTCLMLFFRALISSSRLRTFSSALCRSSASARCCSSFLWSCSRILLYSMRALWCFSCSCLKRNLPWEEREKRESTSQTPASCRPPSTCTVELTWDCSCLFPTPVWDVLGWTCCLWSHPAGSWARCVPAPAERFYPLDGCVCLSPSGWCVRTHETCSVVSPHSQSLQDRHKHIFICCTSVCFQLTGADRLTQIAWVKLFEEQRGVAVSRYWSLQLLSSCVRRLGEIFEIIRHFQLSSALCRRH